MILSLFCSDLIYLFGCFIIDITYKHNKPVLNRNLFKQLSKKTFFLIALPLFIFSLVKVILIIIEECSFFIKHIEHINNKGVNITGTSNSSYIDHTNTRFGELNYSPFLVLGLICFMKNIKGNVENYNDYSNYIVNKKYNKKYSIYDPRAINGVSQGIQNIGKFSLLRFTVWIRHQLPQIMDMY